MGKKYRLKEIGLNLKQFNNLEPNPCLEYLKQCCGSKKWLTKMEESRPFTSLEQMLERATEIWNNLAEEDWLQAFLHHPPIGMNKNAIANKFAKNSNFSTKEQAGVRGSSIQVLKKLEELNKQYQQKFGFIFLINASDKTGEEILEFLQKRIHSDRATEIRTAAEQLAFINTRRLTKMFQKSHQTMD